MNYTITESSMAPMAKINLDRGEEIKIERGSMVYHNGKIKIEGATNGGFMKSLGRSLVSGESMFITTATGTDDGGQIAIAPDVIGDIKALECGNRQWILNDGAFLACENSVEYEVVRQKKLSNAFFGGTGGFFNMHTKGNGIVLINCFGEMEEIVLKSGDKFVCDNSHAVAWTNNLEYGLKVASGTFGFKTGEGLVIEFTGEGSVFIQSRQVAGFAQHIGRYISTSS